jgi:hypothetical protein
VTKTIPPHLLIPLNSSVLDPMLSPPDSDRREVGNAKEHEDSTPRPSSENGAELKNANNTLEPEPARDVTSASIHPDEVRFAASPPNNIKHLTATLHYSTTMNPKPKV